MNEVVLTSDDSSSVYSSRFDALYHSKHGAIQESIHVFVKSGLHYFVSSKFYSSEHPITILEIGFGTGLNAYLTLLDTCSDSVKIGYTALEAYPLEYDVLNSLNYTKILGHKDEFKRIHELEWNKPENLSKDFTLHKVLTLFQDFKSEISFDIIYFDAFAPNTQQELWDIDMMKKMYSLSHNGSILVTYCSKGTVRRNMQEAGFDVSRIPGPPGKREMLRAIKTS